MEVSYEARATRIQHETSRRRTFAIISHPDAGKTTLTEKLLLYTGALHLAGAVRARKNQRAVTSDWMAVERERGISITSTVLQFEYGDYLLNLLDTPGHEDFSEDTYRTLMAVDSAIMVLDGAKGIEPQTKKLFDVCRMRTTPILTFINKMDRPALEPLALLDEIESSLKIKAVPMNWPIGDGPSFVGVYDLVNKQVLRFERTAHGQEKSAIIKSELPDPTLENLLGEVAYEQLCEDVELLSIAGASFDLDGYRNGELTPVFFGSALSNFGIEPFLSALVDFAPPPQPRFSDNQQIQPTSPDFSGFIFKMQANMDPKHRDRVAFLRVCSGRFHKGMAVRSVSSPRETTLDRAYRVFGQERETIEEAFPGDVVGIVNPGLFSIGDTLYTSSPVRFDAVPTFQPEHFAILHNRDVAKYKQFYKGLEQLEEEGAIQVFFPVENIRREPILAAVGVLQFDVVCSRLETEYNVQASIESLAFVHARRISADAETISQIQWPSTGTMRVHDRAGQQIALFASNWTLKYTQERNPGVSFREFGLITTTD